MAKHVLVDMIDTAFVEQHPERDTPFRNHLGGSMIGKTCERELYYSFRWFKRPTFKGRMLRLFDRGHKEEFRFVAFLRSIGIRVREFSEALWFNTSTNEYMLREWDADDSGGTGAWEDVTGLEAHMANAARVGIKPKQWRISDVDNHFGGSLDGIASAPFDIPIMRHEEGRGLVDTGEVIPAGEQFLNEFKTHNTKSFVQLEANGVKGAKPIHWDQMQIYMHKRGLRFAVYVAVNKNDDDLYIETVEYAGAEVCLPLIEKARRVIYATHVPQRVGKHASWHECKWCDFKDICHYGDQALLDRNCRTCVNSQPVDGGQWRCKLWDAIIPVDAMLNGCKSHKIITD